MTPFEKAAERAPKVLPSAVAELVGDRLLGVRAPSPADFALVNEILSLPVTWQSRLEALLQEMRDAGVTVSGHSDCCGCSHDIYMDLTTPAGDESSVRLDQS